MNALEDWIVPALGIKQWDQVLGIRRNSILLLSRYVHFMVVVATLGQCETRTNINREIIGSCLKFEPFLAIVIIVIKTK